jgi:predicted enzyme related to lactoylglutathione lyase
MEVTRYDHGVPSFVDLGAGDPAKAGEFYTSLFGWEIRDMGPDAGGYSMCELRGKVVAGLGPKTDPGPPRWTTYVTVDSAAAAVEAAKANGGQVIVEPMDVFDAGTMAVLADPTGAVFSVWQAKQHIGSQLVNEPGALCWNELVSTDVDAARAFYPAIFGWSFEVHKGDGMEYTEWRIGDRSVGGLMAKPAAMPPQVPSHWAVYFAVDDCDAAIKQVTELGGRQMTPAMDIPQGRFAFVTDPEGAPLGVIALAGG